MDEQIKGLAARMAFGTLYKAISDHAEFWAQWIEMRCGPMADFFAPSPEEQAAAKALGDALKEMKKTLDTVDELDRETDDGIHTG